MPDKNVTSGIVRGTATLVNAARIISGINTGGGGGTSSSSSKPSSGGGGAVVAPKSAPKPAPPPNYAVQQYSNAAHSGEGDVITNKAYVAPEYKPLEQATITDQAEDSKAPTGTTSLFDSSDMTIYTPPKTVPAAAPMKDPVGGYLTNSFDRPSLQQSGPPPATLYQPPSPVPFRQSLGTGPTKSVGGWASSTGSTQPSRPFPLSNFASMAKAPLSGPGNSIGAQAMAASGAAARGPVRSYKAGRGFGR
jgi:hypothetical protein